MACLFALSACSHEAAPPHEPLPVAKADGVDPTLPSWAPKTCAEYHAAVVKFSHCGEIALDLRDKVSAQYDADNKAWHDIADAKQSDLDQVKLACGDQTSSVNAQMTGKCTNVEATAQQ
jgi:hypothetical protein